MEEGFVHCMWKRKDDEEEGIDRYCVDAKTTSWFTERMLYPRVKLKESSAWNVTEDASTMGCRTPSIEKREEEDEGDAKEDTSRSFSTLEEVSEEGSFWSTDGIWKIGDEPSFRNDLRRALLWEKEETNVRESEEQGVLAFDVEILRCFLKLADEPRGFMQGTILPEPLFGIMKGMLVQGNWQIVEILPFHPSTMRARIGQLPNEDAWRDLLEHIQAQGEKENSATDACTIVGAILARSGLGVNFPSELRRILDNVQQPSNEPPAWTLPVHARFLGVVDTLRSRHNFPVLEVYDLHSRTPVYFDVT